MLSGLMMDTPLLITSIMRFAERNFVLYPLRDVAGDKWVLPDGRELGTLVSLCPQGDLERTAIALGPAAPA